MWATGRREQRAKRQMIVFTTNPAGRQFPLSWSDEVQLIFLFQRWIIGGDFDQGPAGSKQKTREGHVGSSNALSSHLELIDLCVKRACRYISTVASGAEESAACK